MKDEMLVVYAAQMFEIRQRLAQIDFGDTGKNTLRDEFCAMADTLHSWSFRGLTPDQKKIRKAEIKELSSWMRMLITSQSLALPPEMEYVLRHLLEQWIGIGINSLTLVFLEDEYRVRRFNKDRAGYYVLETKYGVRFSKDPVFIGIPRHYKEDLLSNIALFHEIGHIVDTQISLMTDVKDEIIKTTNKSCDKKIIKEYFPIIAAEGVFDETVLVSYIKEYIADLFSAQYLGNYITDFVEFLEFGEKINDNRSHPPLEKRKQVVNDFLDCMNLSSHFTTNYLLKYIMDSFHNSGKGDLQTRWSPFSGDELLKGNTVTITNEDELFSVFKHAWDVICTGVTTVERARQLPPNSLSYHGFYESFNSRVKDSIASYRQQHP